MHLLNQEGTKLETASLDVPIIFLQRSVSPWRNCRSLMSCKVDGFHISYVFIFFLQHSGGDVNQEAPKVGKEGRDETQMRRIIFSREINKT